MYTILKVLILVGIILSCFTASIVIAESPAPVAKPLTPQELVHKYAQLYHVSEAEMSKTIACESSWDVNNHYQTPYEDSWGLVQINLKAHSTITKEQATNADFASRFMAEQFSKGHQKMWSCWAKLYK